MRANSRESVQQGVELTKKQGTCVAYLALSVASTADENYERSIKTPLFSKTAIFQISINRACIVDVISQQKRLELFSRIVEIFNRYFAYPIKIAYYLIFRLGNKDGC